jgi:GR25 family glycosyltransferase involved in LPS biosynthesis
MDISQIKHTYYINLQERPDRKDQVEQELKNIGITNPQRFDAIKCSFGAVGCSLSHLKCLEMAKSQHWDHLLIVEDDITFLNPGLFITQFNKFLNNCKEWDVVLLSGNNIGNHTVIEDSYVKIHNCQCTTGYFVKNTYFDKLIKNFQTGIIEFIKYPSEGKHFALDMYWKHLQVTDKWFLITPLTVIQRPGYSNVEEQYTDYTSMMLDFEFNP